MNFTRGKILQLSLKTKKSPLPLEYFESVVDFPVALLCFDFPDEVADLTLHKGPVVEQTTVDIQDEFLGDTPPGKLICISCEAL